MTASTYLFFPGCKISGQLPAYGAATEALLEKLGIGLDHTELTCCGYPARDTDLVASVYSAARNLAIAARCHLPILTPCKCCFGQLRHAQYWMAGHEQLAGRVKTLLAGEHLTWSPDVRVRHLLTVLAEDIGIETIRRHVHRPLTSLKVAAHYGCHALRPGHVTRFDNPLSPTVFEKLIRAAGANPVDWPLRLECCGHPLWGKNDPLALDLMDRKLEDAAQSGAQVLVTACTYCQIQFDQVRGDHRPEAQPALPAVTVTQLLGRAMGLPADILALDQNRLTWIPGPPAI